MAVQLPPFPVNSPPGSWMWVDWWKKLQDYIADITNVAEQDTASNSDVTGLTGYLNIDVPWVVIGNYCQFDIDIDMNGAPIAAANATINLSSGGGRTPPPATFQDGLLYMAAWGALSGPQVQSLGIGYITRVGGNTMAYLPDFSISGYDRIHITGRYNLS